MPSLHQGDVLEEEVEEEEWSDAGRHPHQHFPAANVLRPYQMHALSHTYCQLLISIYRINHSNLSLCFTTSVVPLPRESLEQFG